MHILLDRHSRSLFIHFNLIISLLSRISVTSSLRDFPFIRILRQQTDQGTFISGTETGCFHSGFLKPMAISRIVHRVRAPMLLAKVAVFLGTSFLWDSGCSFSTRLLCTLFLAVQSFLIARSVGFLGSFLTTYALNSLERQKERTPGVPPFL